MLPIKTIFQKQKKGKLGPFWFPTLLALQGVGRGLKPNQSPIRYQLPSKDDARSEANPSHPSSSGAPPSPPLPHPPTPLARADTKGKRKALFFTLWFHSLLFWLYVVARIIVSNVRLYALFIDYIPHITFFELGIATFLSSMLFMYLFLKESWT